MTKKNKRESIKLKVSKSDTREIIWIDAIIGKEEVALAAEGEVALDVDAYIAAIRGPGTIETKEERTRGQ